MAAAVVLSFCAGPGGNGRLGSVDASGDGTLRIGLILDNTESTGADTAAQARDLVAAKADVVIGPTDSSRAAASIDVLSRAKVAVISPANTAPGLSKYNSGGYYFRTAAADIAQAPVLVKLAKDGGARNIAVVHEGGAYGKEVSVAVASAAKAAGLGLSVDAEFKAGNAQQAAAAAKAASPDAVVLVARDGAQGAIAELNNAGLAGSKLILSDGAVSQYGGGLGSRALDGARGILPGTFPSAHFQADLVDVDPGLKDMAFAAAAAGDDAVNVAALAAAAAGDDAGASIASRLIGVSGGTEPDAALPPRGDSCLPVLRRMCRGTPGRKASGLQRPIRPDQFRQQGRYHRRRVHALPLWCGQQSHDEWDRSGAQRQLLIAGSEARAAAAGPPAIRACTLPGGVLIMELALPRIDC